ncbi:MAG: hypothetical protein HYX89_01345 [Chloroflexi bacterium]|nr:hypothetical protein [Chloroflexota bacterium]
MHVIPIRPVERVIEQMRSQRTRPREEDADWSVLDRLAERNADKDPDEVLRDVTAVVEEVRRERYERKKAQASKSRR